MALKLPDFSRINVAVIGDVMLDRYWTGNTSRISPEAPVPVVHVQDNEEKPGGAGNVAVNLQSLGVHTSLYGAIGDDEAGERLLDSVYKAGIKTHLQKLSGFPTITKLRVLSFHQQLIRLDFEESFTKTNQVKITDELIDQLNNFQAVIISDYHKGSLQNVDQLIATAKQHGVPVFVDPKGESFDKYRGATILTPNRKEFERVVGSCSSEEELVAKAKQAINRYDLQAILVTRGSEGMSFVQGERKTIHLPAKAYEVLDVTGAGDTVIAVLAASIAAGVDPETAVNFANTAAGITVTRLGAATVTVPELRRYLRKQQHSQLGVLNREQAILACEDAKERGETIVMTNGCFDVLHPGHIAYLEAAKQYGDRLLVAVNSDESVSRIKGPNRPIKNLEERMSILAGMRAVDWVVPFHEDTPENLIKQITPQVLVKGVDYKIEEIAGHKHVLAHGGKVELVGPEKKWSSTELINKIKQTESVE